MLFLLLLLASAGGVLVGLATLLAPAARLAWWAETARRMAYVLAFVAVTVGVVTLDGRTAIAMVLVLLAAAVMAARDPWVACGVAAVALVLPRDVAEELFRFLHLAMGVLAVAVAVRAGDVPAEAPETADAAV